MKIQYLASLCLVVLLPAVAHAQFGSMHDDSGPMLAVIRTQPLTVLLEGEDPKVLRELAGKPAELAQYKAYLTQRDAQWRELAAKLWKYSPSVEFRSESEYKELTKTRKTARVLLHYTERSSSHQYNRSMTVHYTARQMACEVHNDDNLRVCYQGPTPLGGVLLPGDIASTLRGLQTRLAQEQAFSGHETSYKVTMATSDLHDMELLELLRTKMLLLDAAGLRDGLTEAEVKQLYPYPVQVVSLSDIEAAILSGDAHYTYLRQLATSGGVVGPVIIDVVSGEMLYASDPFGTKGIDKKDLQYLTKAIAAHPKDAERRAKLQKTISEAKR